MKKRIIFMFCAIFAAITICTAQNNADEKKAAFEAKRAEMVKKATERMKNDLSLSDEQATKLEALNNEYLPKMRAGQPAMRRHKPGRPNGNHSKENFKGMKGDKYCNCSCQCCQESAKCDKAPKGDKAKKFDKVKKGDKKFKKLSKKQMKKHKEMMKKREEMMKKREEMMKKREEEMRETRKAYNAKLNEILTPEQQEKLKSMRQERKGKKPANK